jgi:hypothetical protein
MNEQYVKALTRFTAVNQLQNDPTQTKIGLSEKENP